MHCGVLRLAFDFSLSCFADRKLLNDRLNHLTSVRQRGLVSEMMFAVRADLIRNLGNMASRCGTHNALSGSLSSLPIRPALSSVQDSDKQLWCCPEHAVAQ